MASSMGKKTTKKKEKVEVKKYLCPYCNKEKPETKFYMSSDPLVMTGRCVMCIECAEKIARNYDPNTKEFGDCTKTSVMQALERLGTGLYKRIELLGSPKVYKTTT